MERCSFLCMLDKYSSSPVKFAVMACSTRMTSLPGTQHAPLLKHFPMFIESLKCIVTALTEKTGQPPFVWVFHLITLSPSVRRLGLVKTLETSKLLCSAFTLHGCREEEEGEKKKKTLCADSVENNEGGRLLQWGSAVLNMENHMHHIHLHLFQCFTAWCTEPWSGKDNTPCMCNKRERGSRESQRLDDKCLWWRPHSQNNRQVCLSATVSAKCSIKTWNLFADKVIFHPSVSRDRWWLRGCVRKMKTDKIKKRKTKIEGGDLEGWRMH